MRELIGGLIVINGLIVGIFLLKEKTIDWKGFGVIALACIAGAVVISNISRITKMTADKSGVTVDIQHQVEQVNTKAAEVAATAAEVKDIKEQVKLLVQNANTTNDKIKESSSQVSNLVETAKQIKHDVAGSQHDVEQTSIQLRALMQAFIETAYFDLSTRHFIPPPQSVKDEILNRLNAIAVIAVPDQAKRAIWVAQMKGELQVILDKLPGQPKPK